MIPGQGAITRFHMPQPTILHASIKIQCSQKREYSFCRVENRLEKRTVGLSCGPVVKNLPADARDVGSIPDPGRSHIPLSDSTCEPHLLKPKCWQLLKPVLVSWSPCSTTREATATRSCCSARKGSPAYCN